MNKTRTRLHGMCALGAVSVIALGLALTTPVHAQEKLKSFDIPAQPLSDALVAYSRQSDVIVFARQSLTEGKLSNAVSGEMPPSQALEQLIGDQSLSYATQEDGSIVLTLTSGRNTNGLPSGSIRVAQADTADDANNRANNENDERDRQKPDEMVVTGTNIRGVAPDSSPSFVFDRQDIAKTGFSTVSEFVQSLPQNFGGSANADTSGGLPGDRTAIQNASNGSSVNLRGLGSGATLVLLNGSRLAPTGAIGDFVDISMIPLSAVERVEVLTDGASAIYGADAISGVVNFVLRDDYDGAETFVRFGSVTEGDLNEYRAGQIFGKSWDTGNVLVSYEFFHRDNLGAEDKDFSSTADLPEDLLPEQESHNVLLTGSQKLGERVRLRGHGTYSQRDSSKASTTVFLPVFHFSTSKQYGGNVGAEIELAGDWLLDVSGGYHKQTEDVDQEIVFFAERNQIRIDSDLWSMNGKVDGTVFRLPGGEMKIAAGLSYREENFSYSVSGDLRAQDKRDAFGAFGEVFVPIVGDDNRKPGVKRLELTIAGRYDDYSDFGDTFNPKVGLLWSPADSLIFRGTYSTSFNPPNLGDTGNTDSSVFAVNYRNSASPTGRSLAIADFRSNPNLGPEESTAWTAGFDYERSVGPGDFDLSVTWFHISFTDRIDEAGQPSAFLNNPTVFADVIFANPDPALTAAVIADADTFLNFSGSSGRPRWTMPGDEEFLLDGRLLNLAETNTSGLDVNLAYEIDTDLGRLNFGLSGSYLFRQEKRITSNSPGFDAVSTVFNPVDLRLRGSASWSRDGFTASTFVNYVDSYVDDRDLLGTGDIPIESWTTVDLILSYDTGDRSGKVFLGDTKFSLSILNLFNEEPPTISTLSGFSNTGFDPTNASPLGRFISFQITKAW